MNKSGKLGNSKSAASVKIVKDLKSILDEPVGVFCEIVDESNVFDWRIYFEGPSGTPYEGGIFEARMSFPPEYPMTPPTLTIMSEFWHPNVYKDGRVCISILHSPGNDPLSGELPEERWMPTQTVATIMLSFQSMLSDPNLSSPANIDSSVMYRDRKAEFKEKVAKLILQANQRVPQHVVIPHPDTNEDERTKKIEKMKKLNELNTFSLTNMDDSDDMGSADLESEDENDDDDDVEGEESDDTCDVELDLVDCPVCKASMIISKGFLKCVTCPILNKKKIFICGRKCYIMDCGEIRPSGVCDNPIKSEDGWKCSRNYHKDDKNAEENFLETLTEDDM